MEASKSERTSKNPGIADYVVARRKHKDCFLDEIDRLIDRKPLEKLLRKKLQRVVNAVGNPAYPPLPMFKILLLQRWYNLSDVAAEESLYDRLSFVRFVGLSLDHDEVPDSSTICRFRQSLLENNVLKRLLDKLNHQLERRGLLAREGAIVDANVVSSSRRPFTRPSAVDNSTASTNHGSVRPRIREYRSVSFMGSLRGGTITGQLPTKNPEGPFFEHPDKCRVKGLRI